MDKKDIKIRVAEIYELHVKCKCGASDKFIIGEKDSIESAMLDIPSRSWNGWSLTPEYSCPKCFLNPPKFQSEEIKEHYK